MDTKKIVVIGGGYAGIQAIKKLANRKNIEITLIDKNGYHYLQTEVYDFIANKSNLSDITIDLVSLLHGIDKKIAFFNAVVEKIDSKNNKILTNKGEVDYDYLIISTGAQTNLPKSINGIEQYSHGVKSLNHAIEFKQKFENLLYYHIKNNDCKELNIVVGGGGLSGIEIATEMAYIKNIYLETIGSKCEGISIYVIDGGSTVLKQFSETVIKATQKRLEKLKIFLKLGVYIQKVDEDTIFLNDNSTLKYNFMIFTGGIFANSIKFDQLMPLNQINQYFSDDFFRIKTEDSVLENIFVAGDVVEVKNSKDEFIPPTAQTAEQMGVIVASHILNLIKNKKLKQVSPKNRGMLIALGGKYAINSLFDDFISFRGYSAYLFKYLITEFYKEPLKTIAQKGFKKLYKK